MDRFTLYATIEETLSLLRALDASGSLANEAAADVAATLDSLRREADRVAGEIDATDDTADYDLDPTAGEWSLTR